MSDSPDPAIRKTVSLPAELWRQIEDYQFSNRIKRETEALRRLIELGLKAAKATSELDLMKLYKKEASKKLSS